MRLILSKLQKYNTETKKIRDKELIKVWKDVKYIL